MFRFGKKKRIDIEKKMKANDFSKNLIENFDKVAYLDANLDVKIAIENGDFKDVLHHLEMFGLNEIEQGLRKFHPDIATYNESLYIEEFFEGNLATERKEIDSTFDHFCKIGYKKIIEKHEIFLEDESQRINSEFNIISNSNLLDVEWMRNAYDDMRYLDPLHHYCMHGYKENRKPNKYFDTTWYIEMYPEVGEKNPLLHYIQEGWKKGYSPSPLFDGKKYLEFYLGMDQPSIEPLNHFLTEGKKNGFKEIRFNYGREDCEVIIESELFLEEWYKFKNTDLHNLDPLLHFCISGYVENRDPNPFFNTKWYKKMYTDIGNVNPLVHYITQGWKLGYSPSPEFDTNQYIRRYLNKNKKNIEPLGHFLKIGRNKGYKVSKLDNKFILPTDNNYSISEKLFPELKKLFNYQFNELKPENFSFNEKSLNIHFVIPDYAIGGGGHMTIFRMVHYLEYFGHNLTLWIHNPSVHKNENDAYDDIIKHYQMIKADVRFIDDMFVEEAIGDIIFATGWDTVWPVMSTKKFKRRFYLVQDHEPSFFAQGSYSELSKYTYSQDLDTICASSWLKYMMEEKYSRWSTSFDLAADKHIFYPPDKKTYNEVPRIAFYARHFTPRRGVELGMIALELLAEEGIKFHVDFFGADLDIDKAPYSAINHGVKSPKYLADLYRKADIGIVFSLTNYSLVPQEMMQCDLPIIEFDTESTRAIYPEDTVLFAGPNPIDIKNKIKKILSDRNLQKRQKTNAKNWVDQFSWEKSASKVEQSLIDRLIELGYKNESIQIHDTIKVSVIVPTYNGGELFKEVLEKIREQKTPWKFEIIIIDSESSDGTFEYVNSCDNVRIVQIKKSDFNHGSTRNYGVELSEGEYIAFITQDAIPSSIYWLYNLVLPLEHYKDAAGVFGKHIAHDNAKFFTKLEILNHFNKFDNMPLCISKDTDLDKYANDISWRQTLHFYSDNNSCLRKSIWKKISYRKVEYGEDHLWANDIIEAGYSKVYSPLSIVKHSHDYNEKDTFIRSKIDGDYYKYFWGYQMIDENNIDKILQDVKDQDSMIILENGLSDDILKERLKIIESRFRGYVEGQNKTPSLFDDDNDERSKF